MRLPAKTLTRLCAGVAATAALAAAVPSLAQTVDEITVMGRLGPDGRPTSLSRAVPIGDIDLRYDAGVAEARARVRAAAHDICRELGESPSARSPISGSCEQDAIRSASDQIRIAVADARSSDYAAVAIVPVPAPYAGPTAAEEDAAADAAASVGDTADASATVPDYSTTVTTTIITNGAVPDTAENRARFGGPLSNGGRQTAPRGN